MDILHQVVAWAKANQLLSSGFLLMSFGGIVATLVASFKSTPWDAWKWLQGRIILSIEVGNDDPLFTWISLWLSEQKYTRRARKLTATTETDDHGRDATPDNGHRLEAVVPDIFFTPAPGHHIFRYKKRWIWLERERKEAGNPKSGQSDDFSSVFRRHETFTLRMIGRSQDGARQLFLEARDAAFQRRAEKRKVELFIASYGAWWQNLGERDTRPLSSVFLPAGSREQMVADVETFLNGRDYYFQRGVPWRRGYLLYGLAGSGKTSIICALSGHFNMNLYILNVSSAKISDDEISALIASVPRRSIVLLEDIDAAFEQRKKSKDVQNRLSFSGLLNALDGAASKEGIVFFMTTNHRDRLDPALIRPGRADVHIEFTYASRTQAEAMFRAFFPDTDVDDFGGQVERSSMTMAEVQQHLLLHRDSSVRALNIATKAEVAA